MRQPPSGQVGRASGVIEDVEHRVLPRAEAPLGFARQIKEVGRGGAVRVGHVPDPIRSVVIAQDGLRALAAAMIRNILRLRHLHHVFVKSED